MSLTMKGSLYAPLAALPQSVAAVPLESDNNSHRIMSYYLRFVPNCLFARGRLVLASG